MAFGVSAKLVSTWHRGKKKPDAGLGGACAGLSGMTKERGWPFDH
jgi:hypothetical protein